MARSLAETADPRDALAGALRVIGESLGWQFGAVWEPAPGRPEVLHCVETWQANAAAHDFGLTSESTELAGGEGLPGRVWRDGEPAWIPDVLADSNFPRGPAARKTGLRAGFCFPIRSARGMLGVMEFFTTNRRELDSELLATMATVGDQIGQVVERRRDAEALLAKEARHKAMLGTSLDCVVIMDHEGRVVDFNPAAERTFGYRAKDAVGREMAELIVPPELRERHRRGLSRYLATEESTLLDRRVEITGTRADGTTFPVELAITRIDLPGPPTFAGYLRDITERKAAEADLRASRLRIVEAADDARRRLERDLHDGAQQRLVSLALSLRLLRSKLDGDADAAEELEAARNELDEALGDLRKLARGIHPSVLSDRGLDAALEGLAGSAPLPVELENTPRERLPAPVESAAYFVVSEALTNVAKYSKATHANISVVRDNGRLVVEVEDDGVGGADPAKGSGLRGLVDRVSALDGDLEVDSRPGLGTTVRATIPCE